MTTPNFDNLSLPEKAAYWATQDFDAIPIIDLTNATSPNIADRKAVALEFQKAALTAGFFYIKNHGVNEELVKKAFNLALEFFALSEEVKGTIDAANNDWFKGWNALYRGKHAEDGGPANYAGDRVEAFEVGMTADTARFMGLAAENMESLGENQWVNGKRWDKADEFRETVQTYFGEILMLGRRLLPLFALALDLDEDWFEDKTKTNFAMQRLLYYPPLEGRPADDQPGIGAHRDWQLFTILRQDHVGGLEVRNLGGDWVTANPIENTFVINIGNQLSRWTNYVFKSTLHRVTPPPAFTARQSSPMFWGADDHIPLVPIPTCVSPERPVTDQLVTAGQYVKMQLERVYNGTMSSEAPTPVAAAA